MTDTSPPRRDATAIQVVNCSLFTKQTFAAFDDVIKKLVVDVRSAFAQPPVLAVEQNGREAALEASRQPWKP